MFYDRFKQLCEMKGISCNKAVLEIGLSNATPTKWRKTGAVPNGETLNRIANYFGVSVSYLLSEKTKNPPALTEKDRRDIARDLEAMMAQLDSGSDMMFDGDPISDEARASIRSALQMGLEIAKVKNKERFTPKKYRKD